MKELQFLYPSFQSGENCTVRRGIKWALSLGEKVLLKATRLRQQVHVKECTKEYYDEIEVTIQKVVVKRFCDITEDDIKTDHWFACRNPEGLLGYMKEAYNDFTDTEICTILYFEIKTGVITKEEST